jgi:AcrR family transcriptional regulator
MSVAARPTSSPQTKSRTKASKASNTSRTALVAEADPPRRQRLAPEERSDQILDVAARLLMEEGFTEVSMERLGREAGISKALVYNYFPSRNDLLRALLERETQRVRAITVDAALSAGGDFVQLLRATTKVAIQIMQERGHLLSKLWAEPAVVRAVADEVRRHREEDVAFLARKLHKLYGVPLDIATATVNMQMASTGAAAEHFSDGRMDADAVTEICLTMILGSLEALQRKYAKPESAGKASRAAKAVKPMKARSSR